jgi:hypothetical protein
VRKNNTNDDTDSISVISEIEHINPGKRHSQKLILENHDTDSKSTVYAIQLAAMKVK